MAVTRVSATERTVGEGEIGDWGPLKRYPWFPKNAVYVDVVTALHYGSAGPSRLDFGARRTVFATGGNRSSTT